MLCTQSILKAIFLALCFHGNVTAKTLDCKNLGNGYFADPDDPSCKTYFLCILGYKIYKQECDNSDVFDPEISECTDSANYNCNKKSICSQNGYIPDPDSKDCSNYKYCELVDGVFAETAYSCPEETFYNPETNLCEADYKCPDHSKCSEDGFIIDKDSEDCSQYIQCVLINGVFTETYFACPNLTYFNPDTTLCDEHYKCPRKQCSEEGYFPDKNSDNCVNYVQCVMIGGSFDESLLSCPDGTFFNPKTTMCESDYKCLKNLTCDCICI